MEDGGSVHGKGSYIVMAGFKWALESGNLFRRLDKGELPQVTNYQFV